VHLTDLAQACRTTPSPRCAKPSRLRQADQGLLQARRGADRGGDPHLVADPHQAPRRHLQSLNTRGLFPAGEGAGYAGGILSAGVDGIKVAEAVALSMAADNA
jgi:hypothetical protein